MKRIGIGYCVVGDFPKEVYNFLETLDILNEILKTKEKNEVKILVRPHHSCGIGDCLGNLNTVLFLACCCAGIPVSNITFVISGYRYTEKFFVSNQLKLVWGDHLTDYGQDFDLSIEGNGSHGLFIDHEFHFSKFINYSDNIIQHANKYSAFIAVYLRFYRCECGHTTAKELMEKFMEAFLNQWDASEQYIICSPHPIIEKQKWPSNVELSTRLSPSVSIPQYNQNERKLNTESAVRDMAILSYSKDTVAFHWDAANYYAVAMFLAKNKVKFNPGSTEEILQKIKENKIEIPWFNKRDIAL